MYASLVQPCIESVRVCRKAPKCMEVAAVLGFYVSPTAKVIRRRDLGLKSHPKDLSVWKWFQRQDTVIIYTGLSNYTLH